MICSANELPVTETLNPNGLRAAGSEFFLDSLIR